MKVILFLFILIGFYFIFEVLKNKENFTIYKSEKEFYLAKNRFPKVGIVSTIKNPHHLEFWINYHQKIGIDKFYLFDDDNQSVLKTGNNIKRYVYNDDYLEKLKECSLFIKFGPSFKEEVMSRQILNCQIALKDAELDGIDWLLHIDADELLYFEKKDGEYETIGSRLMDVPKNIDWLIILNYEVLVDKENADNCFTDLSFFRNRKKASKFKAYGNGKGLCRVKKEMEPAGVHEFYNNKLDKDRHMILAHTQILHFCSCRFDDWKLKYENLGDFPDHYWNLPSNNKVFDFHAKSRDIRNDDFDKKKQFYKNEFVLSNEEIKIMMDDGVAEKVDVKKWVL